MTTDDTDRSPDFAAIAAGELEAASQLIASVLRTPEEGLEQLRSKLAAELGDVDLVHLRLARAHLQATYFALKLGDEARWDELAMAMRVLTPPTTSSSAPPRQSAGFGSLSQNAFLGGPPPALPFDGDEPPPRSDAPPSEPAATAQQAGRRQSDTEPPGPPVASQPLPFVSTPRPPSVAAVSVDAPPSSVQDEETMASAGIDGHPATGDAQKALSVSEVLGLNVEQFALLCVKCERSPGDIEAVHAQLGIHGEQAREALHQQWQQRLTGDEALRRSWDALCDKYRTSFRVAPDSG